MLERWLRIHTALPEDLASIPSSYISGLIVSFNSSSQRLDASSLQGHEHMCTYPYTDTHAYTQLKIAKVYHCKKNKDIAWSLERWV